MQRVPLLPSAKKILLLAERPVYSPLPPPPPPVPTFLLLENSAFLLLETGGKIELE